VGTIASPLVNLGVPGRAAFALVCAVRCLQLITAFLLAAMTALVFCGMIARYAFHSPIIEIDELSSVLFVWIAVLGAALASYSGEHMRMSAVVDRLSMRAQQRLRVIQDKAILAFSSMLLLAGVMAAIDELEIYLPATNISSVWRAGAIPCGALLVILFSLGRQCVENSARSVLWSLVTVAVALAVAAASPPLLEDLGRLNLLLFFGILLSLFVFSGLPLAFAFGLATVGYVLFATQAPISVVAGRMTEGMSHTILLSVPLFVFLGKVIEMTGLARNIVEFLASLLQRVRGGLSYVLIGAMYLVSGISGSKAADMAAIIPVLLPEMKKRGAEEGDVVALLAATGAQTETVPPSIVLITIGSVTSISISALFAGGILPAFMCGIALCMVVGWRHRSEEMPVLIAQSPRPLVSRLLVASPALALPFIVRFLVVEGVATTTEVSTIAILYSVVVGVLIYRQFDWSRLLPMAIETVVLSGSILLIVGAATAMGWGLTQSGFSRLLASSITALPGGIPVFLIASIIMFIVLGSILEGIPAIVLFGPLLFPVAKSLGVNDVHYAIIIVLSMGVGLFSPPFGVGYYIACAIARVDPKKGMGSILVYMAVLFIGLLVVAAVPWLSTVLITQ